MEFLPAWIPVTDPFDLAALIAGLLCVVLLIRQNIWTWPLGVLYVLCASVVLWRQGLYFSLGLHGAFLALNLYGWWSWLAGRGDDDGGLPVRRSAPALLAALVLGALIVAGTLGWLMDRYTDARLAYWDATGSALSLAAMWLSARKRIENWAFWFVVDVLYAGVYFATSATFLGVLYLVYVPMAVAGWLAWRRTLEAQETLAAEPA
jgi:nicotinamide mononucleotide transporter